jgi:hypothetical protein
MRHALAPFNAALAVLVTALLTACAAYGPGDIRVGDAEAAVVQSMGAPAARYALPSGATRLAYARGPFGKHTYMVDLSADGRVSSVHQALGERQFSALPTGISTEELLLTLGPPAERRPLGLMPGTVWNYRYPTHDCRWFQVTLSLDGRVQSGSYGPDPECEERPRFP